MVKTICFALLLALPALSTASDESLQKLNRNPFEPPELFAKPKHEVKSALKNKAGLELRATMVSEGWSMANVNGRMLYPGDEIRGYRLLEVRENEAVFVKDGKKVIVTIKPGLAQ